MPRRIVLRRFVAMFVALTLTACGSDSTGPAAVATVSVSPATFSVMAGGSQQLAASVRDAAGNVLERSLVWTSSDTLRARVDASGLVTAGRGNGPVTISATAEGVSGSANATVTVTPVAVAAAPVACYPFEGDAADASVAGLDGAVLGGTSFVSGLEGQAVALDGTDGYVSLPPVLAEDFSIAGWIYYSTAPGIWSRFFEQSKDQDFPDTGTMFVTLNEGHGRLVGRIWSGAGLSGQTLPGAATPSLGAWHHIVYTYDQGGTGMALFVDGVLSGVFAYNAEGFDDWGTQILNLGRSSWSADDDVYVRADFDEVVLYDQALSDANAVWLYETGRTCADVLGSP